MQATRQTASETLPVFPKKPGKSGPALKSVLTPRMALAGSWVFHSATALAARWSAARPESLTSISAPRTHAAMARLATRAAVFPSAAYLAAQAKSLFSGAPCGTPSALRAGADSACAAIRSRSRLTPVGSLRACSRSSRPCASTSSAPWRSSARRSASISRTYSPVHAGSSHMRTRGLGVLGWAGVRVDGADAGGGGRRTWSGPRWWRLEGRRSCRKGAESLGRFRFRSGTSCMAAVRTECPCVSGVEVGRYRRVTEGNQRRTQVS